MSNRQVFPETGFPILRGDVFASTGAVTCTVVGIQDIPVISPPVEPNDGDTFFYSAYNNEWYYSSPWEIPDGQDLTFRAPMDILPLDFRGSHQTHSR